MKFLHGDRAWVIFFCGSSLGLLDHRRHKPLPSERFGLGGARYWHIGPWCIRYRRYARPSTTPSSGTPAAAGPERKA